MSELQEQLPFEQGIESLQYLPIDPNARTTMSGHINAVSKRLHLPAPDDLAKAEQLLDPDRLTNALFNNSTVPTENFSRPAKSRGKSRSVGIYDGVAFNADYYPFVIVSPERLAAVATSRSRVNNREEPDREIAENKIQRASIHAIENRTSALDKVKEQLEFDYIVLKAVWRDLQGKRRGHRRFKASNLDLFLQRSEELIHASVETAGTVQEWTPDKRELALNGIRYKLWGSKNNNQRLDNWSDYIAVSGKHTLAQHAKVRQSLWRAQKYVENHKVDDE